MIFTGSMFIGLGIGFLIGNVPAGTLIGMGVGFILQELFSRGYFKRKNKNASH